LRKLHSLPEALDWLKWIGGLPMEFGKWQIGNGRKLPSPN